MEVKEEKIKTKFLKKVWYSITKFEQYPAMAAEGLKRAILYLIIMTAIVSIFAMIGSLIETNKMMEGLAQYIQQNIPEFTISDGNLTMETSEPIIIEDIEEIAIDRVVINPLIETEEQKEQTENEKAVVGITVFLFKDEIVLQTKTEDNQVFKQPYTYNSFIASYTGENIQTLTKSELVDYLTSQKMMQFYSRYAVSLFVYLLSANIILMLVDTLEIAILGWVTARMARIKMKFAAIYNMAIYSLTLSMILNILYIIINYFMDFTITYFQVAYITIAYIYLAATIFIIKDDYIRKMQEVQKIRKEQEKVKEEIEEQEKQKEENKEEHPEKQKEDKEDKHGEEPQGSQA